MAHPVRAKAYAALAHVSVDYEEEAPLLDPEHPDPTAAEVWTQPARTRE